MKLLSFFTLFACLVALSKAAPIPSAPGEASGSGSGKGKGRARPVESDSEEEQRLHELAGSEGGWSTPPNRPLTIHTPPPASLFSSPHGSRTPSTPGTPVTPGHASHDIPLPGRSGVHHDPKTGITTAYYGDDKLPEHMGHLQRNQEKHPSNREPMSLASTAQHDQNRDEALHNIQSGGFYRNTKWPAVRDEKHIAMLDNPNHGHTTTVEKLPSHESSREGALTSQLKAEMQAHGSKGQLRANPGWLTPASHQRIAHEAPATLNSETRRPGAPAWDPKKKTTTSSSSRSKPDPEVLAEQARKKAEGYAPVAGNKQLRQRKGVEPPPPPVRKAPKPKSGESHLTPGRVGPPGHLWHPNAQGASHTGAPAPLSESFSQGRHPPRPQNQAHLLSQKLQSHAAEQAALQHGHSAPANPHPGPNLHNAAHDTEHFRNNLAKFNAAHPPHAPAHGAHTAEAPGRLQHTPDTHHDAHTATPHHDAHASTSHHNGNTAAPAPHHNAPSTSHQATLPHHPAPAQQGSSGSGKSKGKSNDKPGKKRG